MPLTSKETFDRSLELIRLCYICAICVMGIVLGVDFGKDAPTWSTVLDGALLGSAVIATLDVTIFIKLQRTIRSLLRLNEDLMQQNEALASERRRRIEIENSLFC